MSNHWKAVFGVILIFIFGCLSGMLCTSLYLRHKAFDFMQRGPEAVTQLLEHRMTGNLNLDANQKEQIHDIILENLQQRKQLQREIQPRVQMANRQTLM